jgi:RHS repeat-associated protein
VLDAGFTLDADNVSDVGNAYTYTGRQFDSETGLYYYRARYYQAQLGRFVRRDPLQFEGSRWNLYEYVNGSVLNAFDPFGEQEGFDIRMNHLIDSGYFDDPTLLSRWNERERNRKLRNGFLVEKHCCGEQSCTLTVDWTQRGDEFRQGYVAAQISVTIAANAECSEKCGGCQGNVQPTITILVTHTGTNTNEFRDGQGFDLAGCGERIPLTLGGRDVNGNLTLTAGGNCGNAVPCTGGDAAIDSNLSSGTTGTLQIKGGFGVQRCGQIVCPWIELELKDQLRDHRID